MITPNHGLRARLYGPLRTRIHQQVSKLRFLVVARAIILRAACVECVEHVDCDCIRQWRLPIRITAVAESDFMDQLWVQDRTLTHLELSIVGRAIESSFLQREEAGSAQAL